SFVPVKASSLTVHRAFAACAIAGTTANAAIASSGARRARNFRLIAIILLAGGDRTDWLGRCCGWLWGAHLVRRVLQGSLLCSAPVLWHAERLVWLSRWPS